MYIQNPTKLYGSEYFRISLPSGEHTNGNGYYQQFRLSQIHWKAVDQKSQRCEDRQSYLKRNKTVAECINNYLEQEIGCSMGLQGSRHGKKMCKNHLRLDG